MRKLSALFVAAALAATLAGCTSSTPPEPESTCTTGPKAGASSALVTATGAADAQPTAVNFPTPIVSTDTQVSTITAGTGATIEPDDIALVNAFAYSGEDGSPITSGSLLMQAKASDVRFSGLVECSTVGSRLAVTIPASSVLNTTDGSASTSKTTAVLILDVTARYLGKANGAEQVPQPGFPSVVTADNGQPGLTILNQAPPTELKYSVLKKGSGATVKKGDSVILNYTGVLWDERTVFDSTWQNGSATAAIAAPLATGADGTTTGLVDGFATALVGQKVGSQVIVIVPPANGFGSNAPPTGVTATSTLVYVFDVLGIQ